MNGVKGSKPAAAHLRGGEKGASSRPVKEPIPAPGPSKPASAPLMDLMDLSEGDSFSTPVAKPSYDPFQELEGLLDGPSSTGAPSSTPAAPPTSSLDFMSLYESSGVPVSSSNDSDLMSLGLPSSSGLESVNARPQAGLLDLNEFPASSPLSGLEQSSSFPAPVLSDRKGPSVQESLQKDATTRQVGVTPTGTNPALFQDLFG